MKWQCQLGIEVGNGGSRRRCVRGLTHRTLRVHPPCYPPCYPPFTLRVLYLYLTIVLLSFHVHKWFHPPCSPSVFTLRVTLRFSPSGRIYTFVYPPVYIQLSYDIYLYYFPNLLQPALE